MADVLTPEEFEKRYGGPKMVQPKVLTPEAFQKRYGNAPTETPLQKIEEKSKGFGGWVGRGIESAGNFIAGTGEYAPKVNPDTGKPYKEIGSASLGRGFKGTLREMYVGGLFNLETDPKYRANLIKKYFPRVKSVEVDKDGDPIFTLRNGEKYILNQRGLSMQDVADTSSFVGKAAIGGALGTGKTILGTAVKSGLTFGGMTAAEDAASNIAGSGRPLDSETAVRAFGGGVLGALGGAGGHALFRGLSSLSRMGGMVRGGKLSPSAERVIRKAGLDPADFTSADVKALRQVLPTARNAEEARRMLLSRRFDVPLTRGQITQNPGQRRFEEMIRKGARDVDTPSTVRVREYLSGGQADRISGAGDDIVRGMTGKPSLTAAGEGMERTQKVLQTLSKREQAAVNRAYKAARDAGETVPAGEARALYDRIRAHVTDNFGPSERAYLDGFKKLIDENPNGVPVKLLESVRRQWGNVSPVNNAFKASKDAKTLLDEGINTPLFAKARSRHMEMSGKFRDDKTIRDIIKTDTGLDGRPTSELTVSPEEAVRKVFGAGLAKTGTARTLGRMKGILGQRSQAWQDVRREASAKLFSSSKPFDSAYEKAMKENATVMRSLFSDAELKKMGEFAELVKVIRTDPNANFSNTAWTLEWLRQRGSGIKEIVGGALPKVIRIPVDAVRARGALRGVGQAPPSGLAPGLGGQGAREALP